MKVIIAGSRGFQDYDFLREKCNVILSNTPEVEIVSGRCSVGRLTFTTKEGIEVYGADGLGERYAEEKGFPVTAFPADWKTHGVKAGPMRNLQMAQYADALIAFKSSASKGTDSMIKLARLHKLKIKVINI